MSLNVPHPVDIHVGSRLRLKRIMLGFSQQDLGEAVGVTFQQIQKYEKGHNRIGSSRLYEFSRTLKTNISYFFEGFGEDESVAQSYGLNESDSTYEDSLNVSPENFAQNDKDVLLLIRYYKSVQDAHMRKKILSLVRGVAQVYGESALTDKMPESVD